jgi:CheY-like chemotaxis protein
MIKPLLRVLVIEDSQDDTYLIVRELQRGGYTVEFERVETKTAMEEALASRTWDAILSDYTMPHFSAMAALETLKVSGRRDCYCSSQGRCP